MDKQIEQALHDLLIGIASADEVELLKQKLATGQVAIGGNVSQSVIVLGTGNTVQLTSQALDALNGRSLLGDLERDLTQAEIKSGLTRLAELVLERAPVLQPVMDKLNRRIYPILQTNPHALSIESRNERTEALAKLNSLCLEITDIAFNALCTGIEPPAYNPCSPFRGLESFRPEDTEYFFGREELTRKLVQKLNEHSFLAVLGASGSGKSSLVMAGLIPALNVPYAIFRPGAEPFVELEKALQANSQLIVVDQFEELFTLSVREQRSDFISRLLEQSQKVRVVITLRADFLGEVAPFAFLKEEVENHQVIVPPMEETELLQAMDRQAGYAGLRFESDLSQQMLDDVSGEPGAMPLLQHALWTMWMRRHGRWLRAEEYRAFGGVKQAIASTAEAVYTHCTDFERERLRDIFLRLTRLDENIDMRDTRRRVRIGDLVPADSDTTATTLLVKQLADARLVVISGGLESTAQTEVEVAHEALIRHWERLRAWLNEDRDNLRLREGVTDDARQWENAGRDESLLNHRGPRLELSLVMSKNHLYRLNSVEQAYLDVCVSLRDRETKAKEFLRRRITTGLIIGSIIALFLASFAVYQMWQAQNQAKIARAGELAAEAVAHRDQAFDLSLLLSIEAFQKADTPQTRSALLGNAQANPQLLQYIRGHNNLVFNVVLSPDGNTLAAGICKREGYKGACLQSEIILWDLNSRQPIGQPIIGFTSEIFSLAFSPDGKILASTSCKEDNHKVCIGEITLWNVRTHQLTQSLKQNENRLINIAFSPDGDILASGAEDGMITLWNMNSFQLTARLFMENSRSIQNLAFSPDGKLLASASEQNYEGQLLPRITLWDTITHRPLRQILTERSVFSISSIAFSPDGNSLASLYVGSDWERFIVLWDLKNEQPFDQSLTGFSFDNMDFSPDGKILLTSTDDGTLILWDVKTRKVIGQPQRGHSDRVSGVDFNSNGKTFVSGSLDGTIILWDLSINQTIGQSIAEGDPIVSSFVFAPDGKMLVSGGDDGSITFWNINSRLPITKLLTGNPNSVTSIAFSPDGRVLASVNKSSDMNNSPAITLWDVESRQPVDQLKTEHAFSIYDLKFSPDGKILASVSIDKVMLWDVAARQLIGPPLAHQIHWASNAAFSPDGKTIALGDAGIFIESDYSDVEITRWDVVTHQIIGNPMRGHNFPVESVAFSPNGKTLASCSSDGVLIIWDVIAQKEIARFLVGINCGAVAYSPDGKNLAVGSYEGITLWDTATRQAIGQLSPSESGKWVTKLAFYPNPDEPVLASSGDLDHSILLWDLDPRFWIQKTCQRVGRNFTFVEWARYFPNEPYRATCPQWPIDSEPVATSIP